MLFPHKIGKGTSVSFASIWIPQNQDCRNPKLREQDEKHAKLSILEIQ